MTTGTETHQHSRVSLPLVGTVVNRPTAIYQRSEKWPPATTLRQHRRHRSRHNSVAGKIVGRRRASLETIPFFQLLFIVTLAMIVLRSSSVLVSARGLPSRYIRTASTPRASSAFVDAKYERQQHVSLPVSSTILSGPIKLKGRQKYQTKGIGIGFGNHLKTTRNVGTRRLHSSTRLHANNGHGANHILDVGDIVELVHDGALQTGVIAESRGSGWFTVKLFNQNSEERAKVEDSIIVKKRRSHLTLLTGSGILEGQPIAATDASEASSSQLNAQDEAPLDLPTVIDLDEMMKSGHADDNAHSSSPDILDTDIEQAIHHSQCDQWVLFSDLHCSPSSLPTCLEVLEKVHSEAAKRNAGVIFLGDFWHHRGTVRIDLLNAVLRSLSSWEVPLIMIPGNHDQVTLGGLEHGLTPLRNAFYVEDARDSFGENDAQKRTMQPGPMIITHPTKFKDAFFVPYIRNPRILEYALQSSPSKSAAAHFVHVDVNGAYMNDLIVSRSGSPLSIFPSLGHEGGGTKPIYSGHFHKPHIVTAPKAASGVAVRYVGSPYQTSLSEAGQEKELLVVDSSQGWNVVESIQLEIGRKYHRLFSAKDLLQLNGVGPTDRIVLSVTSVELEEARRGDSADESNDVSPFDSKVKSLRKLGASVEIREMRQAVAPIPLGATGIDNMAHEEMTPENTLKAYLAQEELRGTIGKESVAELLQAGISLVESIWNELESSGAFGKVSLHGNGASLEFVSVTAKGFGPFFDEIYYPLSERGLVLLRGNNQDEGSDSNGSGKTTLAMSVLWALTGSSDPRPMQDAKVSDVINFQSQSARVSVSGKINDVPFEVTRVKSASKGSLSFVLDGKDLTRQSMKDTQAVIDEDLGISTPILARTIFHGQHAINGLLEATDAALKDELSLLVPLAIWQQAASFARRSQRSHSRRMAELAGMVSVREQDRSVLADKCRSAKDSSEAYAHLYETRKYQVEEQLQKMQQSLEGASTNGTRIEECKQGFDDAARRVKTSEDTLSKLQKDRDASLNMLQSELHQLLMLDKSIAKDTQSSSRSADRSESILERAKEKLQELRSMWGIEATDLEGLSLPLKCPTCRQSIENDGGADHSHSDLSMSIRLDFDEATKRVEDAETMYISSRDEYEALALKQIASEQEIDELKEKVRDVTASWDERVGKAQTAMVMARDSMSKWSAQLQLAEESYRQAAAFESVENSAKAELERLMSDADSSKVAYQELEDELSSIDKTLQDLNNEKSGAENSSRILSKLADIFGPRGIQSFVLQNAVQSLSSLSQNYLDILSDDTLRLELALESGDRISRTAHIRSPDGNWIDRPLSSLSGGQWRRCSLALSMGFTDLVAQQKNIQSSLMVLDEPLTHLDATGRAQVGKILRGLLQKGRDERDGIGWDSTKSNLSTIVLILQDLAAEELEESFDSIDEVVKDDGSSRVAMDGMKQLGDSMLLSKRA